MTRHIVALIGDEDPASVAPDVDEPGRIDLRFNSKERVRLQEDALWLELARGSLVPPQVAIDFFRMAATAFSADLRVARTGGFDGWERHFTLHLPVQDPDLWRAATPRLQRALGFLSGDSWEFVFRQRAAPAPTPNPRKKREHAGATKICLLSGGLDSFIGAVDEITRGEKVICVSHNAAGSSTFSSPAQKRTMQLLAAIKGAEAVSHVKASVSPPKSISNESEPTQRSRSIMFIGIGVLAASAASAREGRPVPLVIPENGFISLNVPLTSGRLGSLSTRTTHPHFIESLQDLLVDLGIAVSIECPFRFLTKGQMLQGTANWDVVAKGARATVSCAHPSVRRFKDKKRDHCGYCVPCIIRRASMYAAGLDVADDYFHDVVLAQDKLTEGELRDLSAFQMAVQSRTSSSSRAAVLAVGPLPGGSSAVTRSIEVYEAGLSEVQRFLSMT